MVATFFIMALAGIVVGVVSGMLGVGGGVIVIPMLRLGFGMPAVVSTATSLFTIIPTSLSGTIGHLRAKTSAPKLGVALGIGGACTSPIGAVLANTSPGWLVMSATALAIAYSGVTMVRKALQAPRTPRARTTGAQAQARGTQQASAPPSMPDFTKADLAKGFAIGAVAGLASGYVGLGGGFLMVPMMMSILHMPMKLTSGTSLVAVAILALPAVVTQGILGNVDFLAGIAVVCGSIPGAQFGSRLTRHLPERTLRFTFAAFLLIAAILLVVNETVWQAA